MNTKVQYTDVNSICYMQPGGVFYACTLPATSVVGRLEIRRRSENPEDGMQRDDNPVRIKEIGKYALGLDAVFPTPIIVSANSDNIKINANQLLIPVGDSILGHVLDGQHRLLGLKNLSSHELLRFNLLMVFVFDIDVYSEATIFSTINSTQKQVSKSLMYDLFALHPGRSIEKTCHEIVRSLNDDHDSPFYRRIKILGKKIDESETLSQAAFIDQVARQIKDTSGPLYQFFKDDKDWVIRKIISNCFSAILGVQSKMANTGFHEDYFLKTTGFGGVAQALKDLVEAGMKDGDVTKQFFINVMENFFSRVKEPPEGVGNSAMLKIKELLVVALANRKT